MFVGNLNFKANREELTAIFAEAGPIIDIKIPMDRETNLPRGFAFVEFADTNAAQRSVDLLNGKDFMGRPLRVTLAENRPPRASAPSLHHSSASAAAAAPPPVEAVPRRFTRRDESPYDSRRPRDKKPQRSERRRHREFDDE
ncbi:MAG: hypothetical protein MUF51_09065 [Vicinamibacteria bacterium]|nr:hypothetical protein [Vicinamibacteria bacterium]